MTKSIPQHQFSFHPGSLRFLEKFPLYPQDLLLLLFYKLLKLLGSAQI
jgi:hypothetical protein